ncbi:MAG: hypothetical protein CVT74_08065 [Alphaproteobacteria bacterium HGW-Alphaproteobacteria-13]|jgi:glycine/D-amino acid oxidase-like deaminating enzyme|nr:MAG: hypothetical protein CVT74_08065 [Alphaproteobacteria bacterium HGW-Alphaproteobacteria-13]
MRKKIAVDVAIVGGGIIGCATAWYLTQRGLSVALFEKGTVAGEQSGRNSGFVRKQGRDEREMPLIKRSLDLWRDIDKQIEGETGFTVAGNLAVAGDEAKLAAMHSWLAVAKEFGVGSEILTNGRLQDVCPRIRRGFLGALYTPTDARAEPELAAPAIAAALRRKGAEVHENCHVQELELSGGRVTGLVTEKFDVKARTVVVAAGLWSYIFLKRYGVFVPQSDLKISVGRTAPFDHGMTIPSWTPDVLVRPRHDGGLTIALGMTRAADFELTSRSLRVAGRFLPTYLMNRRGVSIGVNGRFFENNRWSSAYLSSDPARYSEIRVPHVPPNVAELEKGTRFARTDFQFDPPIRLVDSWACRVDLTPDGIPVIGETLPGLVVATGMSGHGFGLSLGVGDSVAELIDRGSTTIALDAFDPGRFRHRYFAAPQNVL